jgi:dTMP kinase
VLIAFEGGEGSGKSTQIERLTQSLRDDGVDVVVTHEPGATGLGRAIRELLLHTDTTIAPRAEALLFAADRADHVSQLIRPALDRGAVVLTDRFIDSSLAYQGGGRDLTLDEVRSLSSWATGGLSADLTVLLDLPAVDGLARAQGRSAADRLEQESIEFHERVQATYQALAAAEPERYLVLDARATIDELAGQIGLAVRRRLAVRT